MSQPSPKAVIVSISSDIGFALAASLKSEGWDVCGTFRTASPATAGLAKIGIGLFACDLSVRGDVALCAKNLREAFGHWDLLVFAPGRLEPIGLFSEVDFEEWAGSVGVNFVEQMHLTHALLPLRNPRARHGPCVLFFAGGGTNNAHLRYSSYTVSKIALTKMCELLHAEMPDTRFTIVAPGWVKTKIHQATLAAKERAGDTFHRAVEHFESDVFVPMPRVVQCCRWVVGSPRDVVGGRIFIVADDAWGTPDLADQLMADAAMYKLRRAGNDWKPRPPRAT